MGRLSTEQLESATARFAQIVAHRNVIQKELERLSGVRQSTISRVLSHARGEEDAYAPTEDLLAKLFQGLGYNLFDIVNEPGWIPEKLFGYLATPLTALDDGAHTELRRLVTEVRSVASDQSFDSLPFDLYWPGDFTHPLEHPDIPARHVYLTDRSRASTHDFIILFCGEASYGVGQENEIATQAGIPAIRLIPEKGISRMMLGSFVRAIDVTYDGTLAAGIRIPREKLKRALAEIKRLCVRHRAFYRAPSVEPFDLRLKRLIVDRCGGDYLTFAYDIGITNDYLHVLMKEPLAISNPGIILLDRIAKRLCTTIGYLLGESEITDPVYVESRASWRKWADASSGLDLALGLKIRDQWCESYLFNKRSRAEASVASFRKQSKVMEVKDWDQLYRNAARSSGVHGPVQPRMI